MKQRDINSLKYIIVTAALMLMLMSSGCYERRVLQFQPEGTVALSFRSLHRNLPDSFEAVVGVSGDGVMEESFRLNIVRTGEVHRATSAITVRFLRRFNLSVTAQFEEYEYIGYGSYDPEGDSSQELRIFLYPEGGEFAGGSGTIADPYLVAAPEHLDRVRNYLDASFIQMGDINLDAAPYNEGWAPIGRRIDGGHPQNQPPFRGHYDGNGFKVKRLAIYDVAQKSHGLFGWTEGATIENLHLENVYVEGNWATGALVGTCQATVIDNCSASGIVKCFGLNEGFGGGSDGVGGLIGATSSLLAEYSVVSNSYSSCRVINGAGGLIGYSNAAVENCYATGEVTSHGQGIGGLVGVNLGSITNSYATGNVSAPYRVGGLIGINRGGAISDSYAAGQVTQSNHDVWQMGMFGGLIGENERAVLTRCYATGSVTAVNGPAGGLVGANLEFAGTQSMIDRCYATGSVTGSNSVGGLAGRNLESSIRNSFAFGNALATGEYVGGLVGQHSISPIYQPARTIVNCYSLGRANGSANIGGLVGASNDPNVLNSYWNTQTSNHTGSPSGAGRTTAEMTFPYAQNTYIGWDFTTIWEADSAGTNSGYPFLRGITGR